MKNNFTQAFKELTGFDISTSDEKEKKTSFTAREVNEETVTVQATKVEPKVVTYKEFSESTSEHCTRITSTMIVHGDVKSDDDIHMDGQIIGNIRTSANLTSSNLILGDVHAQNLRLNGARLRGNVDVKGDLVLGGKSVVVGDINCDQLSVSGKIKGDCHVQNVASLDETAYLLGNISTKELATQQGAKIIGAINIFTEDPDIDADFDFGGDF